MEPESPVCPGPSSKRPRNAVQDNVGGSVSGIESSYQNLEPTVRLNDLTVLYDPPVDVHPVIADVIFVHGLQGHAQKTWQSTVQLPARNRSIFNIPFRKRNREDLGNCSSGGVFWPRDLLPYDHKNLRILTYGYDSHSSHYFSGPANKLNLSQLGQALLNRVVGERHRSKVSGRPIIFIAHSLGGLLVKEALVESKKQGFQSNKSDVFKSTRGVVFFGTPHKGSNDAKWGQLIRSIASAAFDTNDKIIRALEPDSELLDKLARDFQDILDEDNLKVCSLLESAGKTGLPVFNGKVVPDFSAAFGSRKFEHLDFIDNNHMGMCRFLGEEDGGYTRFRDGLEFCINNINGVETVQEGLVQSLKYEHIMAREEQIVNAKLSTLEWVWSVPSGHACISEWFATKPGVFWIQGKPGSGKSTLLTYLKDHKNTKYFLNQSNDHEWAILRFFFDFRARNGLPNSFEGLLRALLLQLSLEIPSLSSSISKFGELDNLQPKHLHELQWTQHKLRQALINTLKTSPLNICIFIDGLDEFEGTARSMLDMIDFLHEVAGLDSSQHQIKLCVASRPHPLIVAAFGNSSGFKLQHYNIDGIKQYVNSRLLSATCDTDAILTSVYPLDHFAKNVTERSQGIFLWAVFAINELLDGISHGDEVEELWTRLKALPDELEAIYSRIIDRIIQKYGSSQETSIMLQIAYFTTRSLSLEEFFTVFQLSRAGEVPTRPYSPIKFENRLRARTGGLVEIVGGASRQVKMIHETVRRYLDSLNSDFDGYNAISVTSPLNVAINDDSIRQPWDASTPKPHDVTPIPAGLESTVTGSVLLDFNKDSLLTSETPITRRPLDVNDACQFGYPARTSQKKGSRRRGPLGYASASGIMVKAIGACLSCRASKYRCDPGAVCARCRRRESTSFLCIRSLPSDTLLINDNCTVLGWLKLPQSFEDLDKINFAGALRGISHIKVTLKRSYGLPVDILARSFNFSDPSKICDQNSFPLKQFGIDNPYHCKTAFETCFRESRKECIRAYVRKHNMPPSICFKTALESTSFSVASNLKNEVEDTLQLWTFARGLDDLWTISSVQILNARTDLPRPFPLTAILHYQFEAVIQLLIIEPLKRKVLKRLYLSFKRHSNDILKIFLVVYILLHNCDIIVNRYRSYSLDNTAETTSDNRHNYRGYIHDIQESGKILLAGYHLHFCKYNRFSITDINSATNGYTRTRNTPISNELQALMLSLDQVIPEEDKHMSRYSNWDTYNGESWFTGQMFVSSDAWRPSPPIITLSPGEEQCR